MKDRMSDDSTAGDRLPGFQVVTANDGGGCIAYLREVDGMSGNGDSEMEAATDLLCKLYQHLDSGQPLDYRKPEPLDDSLGNYAIMLDLDRNSFTLWQLN